MPRLFNFAGARGQALRNIVEGLEEQIAISPAQTRRLLREDAVVANRHTLDTLPSFSECLIDDDVDRYLEELHTYGEASFTYFWHDTPPSTRTLPTNLRFKQRCMKKAILKFRINTHANSS